MTPHYECLVVSRTPHETGYPALELVDRIVPLRNLSWADELVGDGRANVAVSPVGLSSAVADRFRNLMEKPSELWIYRDGVLVHAGPIIGLQNQGTTISLVSQGTLYYLKYMYVQRDYTAKNLTPFRIVQQLIAQWGNKEDGTADNYTNYGIRIDNIDGTKPVDSAGNAITRSLEIKGDQLRNVHDAITELSNAEFVGFDFYIDHSTFRSENGEGRFGERGNRELVLVNDAGVGRGVDRSSEVVLELRNLHDVRLWSSVTKDDIASWVKIVGTDDDKRASHVEEDLTLKQQFGKAGVVASVSGTTNLDRIAERTLHLRNTYYLKVGGSEQFATAFSMPGTDAMSFFPGDVIGFVWNAGYGWIEEKRAVYRKYVSMDPTGTEKITVEFV